MNCLNCGHPVEENYCPNCGQHVKVDRFGWRYFGKKFLDIFDVDQGFFSTCYKLMIKPGLAVREYMEGKRVGFSNPIKMFLIIGAIATYLTFNFNLFITGEITQYPFFTDFEQWKGFTTYSVRYFSFFTLTGIPFFAISSWLFFKKSGFNFSENLVLNFYVAVGQFIIVILLAPIVIMFNNDFMTFVYGFLNAAYNIWFLYQFFRPNQKSGIFKAILAVILAQLVTMPINYYLFTMIPGQFWPYLDNLMG